MRILAAGIAVVLLAGSLSAAQKKAAAPAKPSASKAAACAAKTVSFSHDVVPILQGHCAACHFDNQKWPGVNMSTAESYSALVNKKSAESGGLLVKPGDPAHSFLVQKLSPKPPAGDPMPTYGRPLSASEKELLVEWIQQGAKNN